jgi:hypothetical protein
MQKQNRKNNRISTPTSDQNTLMTFIMYFTLFNKKLFDDEKRIIQYFPKNVFGIFSTIRRSQKNKSWPEDIHGCIGHWDTNFNTLDAKSLYDNLLRVAYDSMWVDNRKQYFKPIETDPYSFQELDFMMNPIYSIDKSNGIIKQLNIPFTNDKFGIIIQTNDNMQRATYLPNVFPNISWKSMVGSIKDKAGITSDDFDLYAYKIIQIKSRLITLLINDTFSHINILNFTRLLLNNAKPKLKYPYIYSCKNNILEWNNDDDVRNISTLGELFNYIYLYPDVATQHELEIIKQKITQILNEPQQYNSQALSFLGNICAMYDINKEAFCKKLLKDLPQADDEFGKPEIIIGLNKAGCLVNKDKYQQQLTFNSNDSIFKMNWTIQTIISFNIKPSNDLSIILENTIDNMLKNKNKQSPETNFYAVAFESLCFLYRSLGKKSLLDKIFGLFYELENRKDCLNTLYTFTDGTARVDITGHINNGLIELHRNYTKKKNT